MFKLIIQDDEGKTTVVPLIRDEISIGRKEGNTIRLTERNVSRRHARLLKNNGAVVLEDLDSYNGIRVNGARIQGKVTVAETDRIQIGDYLLELKVDRGTAGPNEPTAEHKPLDPASGPPTGDTAANAKTLTGVGPAPGIAPPAAVPAATSDDPTVRVEAAPAAAAAAAAQPAAQAQQAARLVCLSSNFAGREFKLEKAAIVIGRTEDNDVVVNHRSISRHHAKIVRDGARYSIVDLQSSNGVRVNGEEYGKVDLRKGDLIDLGHVRLRFVEAGEDFVFHRDATVVDLSLEGKKSRAPLIIAALVLIAGAAALFYVMRKPDEPAPTPTPPVAGQHPPAAAPDAAPVAAAPPDAAPAAPPSEEVVAKLALGQRAIADQDWSSALAAADAVLKKDPENAEAKKLAELARREAEAQTAFEVVTKAAAARKVEDAVAALAQIPEDSVYRAKAQAKLDPVLGKWADDQLRAAKTAADGGKCDRIEGQRDALTRLAPDRLADLDKQAQRCIVNRDKPKAPEDPPPGPGPGPVKPPEPRPTGDPVALLEEAKSAFNAGQFEAARTKADKVLALQPGNQGALSTATLASCRLGRADLAKRYASKLEAARREAAARACQSAGITL